jgi:hypothetical protein
MILLLVTLQKIGKGCGCSRKSAQHNESEELYERYPTADLGRVDSGRRQKDISLSDRLMDAGFTLHDPIKLTYYLSGLHGCRSILHETAGGLSRAVMHI